MTAEESDSANSGQFRRGEVKSGHLQRIRIHFYIIQAPLKHSWLLIVRSFCDFNSGLGKKGNSNRCGTEYCDVK